MSSTIEDSDEVLGRFPGKRTYNVKRSSRPGQAMFRNATVLGDYNHGNLSRVARHRLRLKEQGCFQQDRRTERCQDRTEVRGRSTESRGGGRGVREVESDLVVREVQVTKSRRRKLCAATGSNAPTPVRT